MAGVSDLLGQTISGIERSSEPDFDELTFTLADGRRFKMYHDPDCCEDVTIEDVCGDMDDLIGSPITMAEESTSRENPPGVTKEDQCSFTWTFYRFATVKGYVTIRWYGESSGWYSESVDFVAID